MFSIRVRVNPNIVSADNISAKSLDRRGVLRLQVDAPVKNTGETRYSNGVAGIMTLQSPFGD